VPPGETSDPPNAARADFKRGSEPVPFDDDFSDAETDDIADLIRIRDER